MLLHFYFTKKNSFHRFWRFFFLPIAVLFSAGGVYAQAKFVSVNKATGTLQISIPLYNIKSGSVSLPVSLEYTGSGVHVKDISGSLGMNWQLNAGGQISRLVRGLPDDCTKNLNGQPRLGWLNNTNGQKINALTLSNDNNFATYADESADVSAITSNFDDFSDTEPDIFYVSAPGLSCQLVFDNNHVIRAVPYADLKIAYTTDSNGNIDSFTITNDQGIKYQFTDIETTIRYAHSNQVTSIGYFKRDFNFYRASNIIGQPKGIAYNSTWHLTSITDPAGNFVSLSYATTDVAVADESNYSHSVDTLNLSANGLKLYQYEMVSKSLPHYLAQISYGDPSASRTALSFTVAGNDQLPASITGFGNTVKFNYMSPGSTSSSGSYPHHRLHLKSITSSSPDCNDPLNYVFEYNGLNYDNSVGAYQTAIPDSSSHQVDYWGFYNGSNATSFLPSLYINPANTSLERFRTMAPGSASGSYPYTLAGADRSANPATVVLGSLSKITYPTGGYTTFTFESNDFYDPTSQAVVSGGGVRIAQITTHYGTNSGSDMVTTYSYLNPATGQTSGKPVSLPVFAFTIPYTGSGSDADKWSHAVIRSESNLSDEDNTIVYSYVRETRAGAGSTLYEYNEPATNWDNSAAPDWAPTVDYVARLTNVAAGYISNDKNAYPFAPNTNFDFERGMLKKMTAFNDNGQEVSESVYTYIRSGAPVEITGFKFDTLSTAIAYARYSIHTMTGELISQVSQKVFDTPTLTQATTTNINYYYNSTQHRLLTDQQLTNSDGTVQQHHMTYVKDYTNAAAVPDNAVNALYQLQANHINSPVERYTQVQKGSVTKTVSAQLTKFSSFTLGGSNVNLPAQQLTLVAADGLTDFHPAAISGGVLAADSRYTVVENDLAYDRQGYLMTRDDNNRNTQTVIIDHAATAPAAVFSRARYDEVGFSDFNNDNAGDFPATGFNYSTPNALTTNSRSGPFGLSLQASAPLTKTLNKSPMAKNYILSVWINSAVAGNLTLTLTTTTNQTTTYTLPYTADGSYRYYELKVPVASLTGALTATVKSSSAVLIDDVLFYPDVAEAATYAYDVVNHQKTAETSTNGTAFYYTYDAAGRLRYVYDQDRQILKKNSYLGGNCSLAFQNNLAFNMPSSATVNTSVTVSISPYSGQLADGVTYTVNFGDGTALVNTSGFTLAHTYVRAGNFVITVTANSPTFGQTAQSQTISVNQPALQMIPVNYFNNVATTTKGFVSSLVLQSGAVISTYTEQDLKNHVSILQGVYTVTVTIGAQGVPAWKGVVFDRGVGDSYCFPQTQGNQFTFTLDLTSSQALTISLNTVACPLQ